MMSTLRAPSVTLIAASILGGSAGRAQAAPPPGPPWPTNAPAMKTRSASDAPDRDYAFAEVAANGSPIGVAVRARAAVAKPHAGGKYELCYQIRVHTRKGQIGPLLATAEFPQGKPFLLKQVTSEYDWIEFYEAFDVTRGAISGMLNMPLREGPGDREVLLRVEPQVFDVAAKKYLTDAMTPPAIIVASVGNQGRVSKLQSLAGWLIEKSRPGSDPRPALTALGELDSLIPAANGVEDAFNTVLLAAEVPAEKKALYIGAVTREMIDAKNRAGYALKRTLGDLSKSADGSLKLAARRKLAEGE